MNMKKNKLYFGILGVLLCMIGAPSCAPDYQTDFEVKTLNVPDRDLAPIVFGLEGGSKDVSVETNVNVENWAVTSNAAWCTVQKTADKVVVSAAANDLYVTRIARVTIAYGHQSFDIPVTQVGNASTLLVEGKKEGTLKDVPVSGGEISVNVSSNMALDYISIPDTANWLKWVSTTGTGDEKVVTFNVDPSYMGSVRYSTILLQSSQNPDHSASFIVKQEERVWGTPIAIPLTIDMLSANATEPYEGSLAALLDNDKGTFYHTLWSSASPGGKPHYLQINLNTPVKFLSFAYDGRSNGNSGDATRVGIWVSDTGADGDENWKKVSTITFTMRSGNGNYYTSNEVAFLNGSYKYIRYIPEARRNTDPINSSGTNGWWYAANFFMFTYDE